MRRIMVATDLSSRADRAMRRAALLAAASGAELLILFVVDDDQPAVMVEVQRREAAALLARAAEGLPELKAIRTRTLIEEGDPFDAILRTAEAQACDLIVVGEHRRRLLRDMLAGTTVERVIRGSRRPVLMVNAIPDAPYRRVLMTSDLSPESAAMLRRAAGTGLFGGASVTVLHAREASGLGAIAMADLPPAAIAGHVAEATRTARAELLRFLAPLDLPGIERPQPMVDSSPAPLAILGAVDRMRPDLLVLGTAGAGGLGRMLLGSVAAEVLRQVRCDALTVPVADA
jgi:nucleotide-binding universal stress UspA family protein